jgi:hypothetical protein
MLMGMALAVESLGRPEAMRGQDGVRICVIERGPSGAVNTEDPTLVAKESDEIKSEITPDSRCGRLEVDPSSRQRPQARSPRPQGP